MRKRRKISEPDKEIKQPKKSSVHKGKPAFVLAADDHVRAGAPQCRIDNYEDAIFRKLEFRNKIAQKHNIPILHSGDLGDKNYFVKDGNGWDVSVYGRYIQEMKVHDIYDCGILCSPGNHDLPGHDIKNIGRSVIGSLVESGVVQVLIGEPEEFDNALVYGCPWGCDIPEPKKEKKKNILVIHKMIINQLPLWPGQDAPKAVDILKQNPDYDLIVSGDNHNTFTAKYNSQLLVNPGSMMRSTTSQFDHKPCFFLYYPESHTVEKVFYPIQDSKKVISLTHIDKKNKNKQRTQEYAKLVNKADLSDLKSFRDNTEIFISNSNLPENVINHIRRFVDHERVI